MFKRLPTPVVAPFSHQLKSLKHADKNNEVFDCSDPGTGKSAVAIWAAEKRIKAKLVRKVLVLAPKSLLRSVWFNDFKKFAPSLKVVVSTAGKHEAMFAEQADIYVTNIDAVKWLAKKTKKFFAGFDELIVDECFPAKTLVDTPCGQRPISSIKVGDLVNTSAGPLPVTTTFMSKSNILFRLGLDDGSEIYCTGNHPIATSEGWRSARNCIGLFAVRLNVHQHSQPRAALLQQAMLKNSVLAKRLQGRADCDVHEGVQVHDGQTSMEQGDRLPGIDKSQAEHVPQGHGAQTRNSWGERAGEPARVYDPGNAPSDMDSAVRNTDETGTHERVPELLQSGLCEPEDEKNSGGRRELAQVAQTLGCEEGHISGLSRVVSVSCHEQRDRVDVFNLQVDGPHDYSVEGTLVHNCTAYKHGTSQRSKAAAKISNYFTYRRLLTGTPNSNTITDIWHQIKLLDGGKRLGKSFFAFRNVVCTPYQKGNHEKAIEWVDKDGAEELVFGMLSDMVIRHKFEDCVDIPENHKYSITYELSKSHRKSYDEMAEQAIMTLYGPEAFLDAKIRGIKPKPLGHITAINAASVATKLLQIASGAVYESPDKYHAVDTERYEMILDLIEQRKHSLTFFLWKHQRDLLIAEAERRGITFAVIDGSVKESEREEIVRAYQAGAYRTIFAHPKSAAHGLTLTKGTTTIWASPTYDLEIFAQGSKRQHRIGQTEKTETIVVVAKDTLDEKAYEALQAKGKRMNNLLDLFATII